MTPVSIPTIPPPPPGQQVFGLGELKTVKKYSRQSFEAEFDVQPDEFNPALPPKYWLDTSPGAVVRQYKTVVKNVQTGQAEYQVFVLPAEQAAKPNIPGSRHFDVYTPAPTGTTSQGFMGSPNPVNPLYLSTRAQADSLAVALGGSVIEFVNDHFPINYAAGDARRWFLLVIGDNQYPVGALVNDMYSKGVGAPGHWQNDQGNPHWISEYNPNAQPTSTQAEVPYPMRDLNTGERFILAGLGGSTIEVAVGVLPTDHGSAAGDGFGADDRSLLARIARSVGAQV